MMFKRLVAAVLAYAFLWTGIAEAAYYGPLPFGVSAGGTGQSSLTAFNLLVGNGTSAVAFVAPSATSGVPLISQGSSGNPAYGTAVVAGGGTGVTSWTANAIPLGAGTSAITFLSEVNGDCVVGASGVWTAGSCGSGGIPSETTYTSNTATLSLAATNLLTEVISQGTPAALTVNLNASESAGFRQCVKDGNNNFATNNATIKVSSGTIDGTTGTTGIIMNQAHEEFCFISDGTNYWIE